VHPSCPGLSWLEAKRAAWLLSLALAIAPARAAGVLSLNLCSDQLLLALADPAEIVGVTSLARDCRISVQCDATQHVPAVRGTAEEVMALRPRLVLAGPTGATTAQDAARRRGIPLIKLPSTPDLGDIPAQVVQVADSVGHPDRGAALSAAFAARLAAFPQPGERRPVAAIYEPNGYSAGPDSLTSSVLARAGLQNWAALHRDQGRIPLERLIADPPDLLVTGEPGSDPSLAEAMLWHPALLQRFAGRRVTVPQRDLICGTPATLDAVEALVRARLALPP